MSKISLLSQFAESRNDTIYNQLVEKHNADLLNFAWSLNAPDPESAVQETWLAVYSDPPQLRGSEQSYLFSVVRFKVADAFQSEAARSRRESAVARQPWHGCQLSDLRVDIQGLPATLARTLTHLLEGLTQRDIASELGVSQATVRRRIAAAKTLMA